VAKPSRAPPAGVVDRSGQHELGGLQVLGNRKRERRQVVADPVGGLLLKRIAVAKRPQRERSHLLARLSDQRALEGEVCKQDPLGGGLPSIATKNARREGTYITLLKGQPKPGDRRICGLELQLEFRIEVLEVAKAVLERRRAFPVAPPGVEDAADLQRSAGTLSPIIDELHGFGKPPYRLRGSRDRLGTAQCEGDTPALVACGRLLERPTQVAHGGMRGAVVKPARRRLT
jgi:hypothetical protein